MASNVHPLPMGSPRRRERGKRFRRLPSDAPLIASRSKHADFDLRHLVILIVLIWFGTGQIMSKIMTTASEEVPTVMVGPWPLLGIGPLHVIFVQ